jgi:triosephosphate isomerase
MFKKPVWITNFKNYEGVIGINAVKLAKIHEKVAKQTGATICVAVGACDVFRVSQEVSIPIFSQHVDAIDFGKFTGHILPQNIKRSGAVGTLLNHSERRLDFEVLENTSSCAQKANLARIICAENPEEIEKFSELDPDFLALEPPELIGSTGKSVASENPASITESIKKARGIPLLVGAGINSVSDVEIALELGASGFLVATAITKSDDPEKALLEFVSVFDKFKGEV